MTNCLAVVDACFAEPRLAAVYDALDGSREDLSLYASLASEVGADSILDLGCGTGTFACMMAERSHTVTGIDPATASIAIARGKPFAEQVRWIVGEINDFNGPPVDLVTMTGNVAQVFVSDTAWAAALRSCRRALHHGGWIAFETREPTREAWRQWTPDQTGQRASIPGIGQVEARCRVTAVELPLVSFRSTYMFFSDGTTTHSESTLRFREREEVAASLADASFRLHDVRDAPDRPAAEMIFLAQAI